MERKRKKEEKMKVSVTYSRTVNLGKFNSVRAEAGIEEEIPLNSLADRPSVFDRLWNEAKIQVQVQLNREIKYE